jgi:hypothetical protein
MNNIELTDEELFLIKKSHQNHIRLCNEAIEYGESTLKYTKLYAEAWLPIHKEILEKLK